MQEIKLHLGCGGKNIPGFINIDLSDYDHIHYRRDIRDLSIFADHHADLIYCCHALEYFDRIEVVAILKEWRRVMKPGGKLRVSVPNFSSIVKIYSKYKDLEHQGILGPLYGKWSATTAETIYHKTVYDKPSLERLLTSVGFKNISSYDPHNTEHAEYDDYSMAYVPHMDKTGIMLSLNIECEK
ncbi:methyltransferase domain-containing protein [Planktomarina temperata]|nr:methyltransferase domain-containing protein [Planktomarina temperata]